MAVLPINLTPLLKTYQNTVCDMGVIRQKWSVAEI